ncbi:SDR family NAD(P)-dependent oxidoreductase [Streptomyces sp. t39]|uniref:SDR family NAD(P)-dependent oxidoreductase n=1 Tax=Streptomyces sp. t39 TaxID=1828156 RepID=UPI0011CDB05B|nr:SDR family oxidoreductase [Streptomyces sp. t39]TXS58141.1 SDR family oxidoreductase [Streptomyces sp. t39]
MTRYSGSRAVVVGQEPGIGLAIAKRLVEGGADVLLTVGGQEERARARTELGSAARLVVLAPPPGPGARGAPGALGALDRLLEAEGAGGADLLFADAVSTARPLLPRVRDGGAVVLTSPVPSAAAVGALAGELAGRGIRVNAVAPGCIEARPAGAVPLPPLGRLGSAEEVARAALFLATDATFTTGAWLPVDGGLGRT